MVVPGRSLPGLVSNSPTASLTLGSLRDPDRLRFLLWLLLLLLVWLLLWLRGSGLYDNRVVYFLLYESLEVQRRLFTPAGVGIRSPPLLFSSSRTDV